MPTIAPTAAMSLTSPAPVAPIACPGIMSIRPTSKPAVDASGETSLSPISASPMPLAAIAAVSQFGMRRERRSTMVATRPPAARAANDVLDTGGSNGVPEHAGDRVADRRDRAERNDRDERAEQAVLQ